MTTSPQAPQRPPVTRDEIREIFLRNGFTIKDGNTDLKEYVYAAAYELLARYAPPKENP